MSTLDTTVPAAAPAVAGEWFCDQCGARYPEPGQCTNQHPAADLKPVNADVHTFAPSDEGYGTVTSATYTGPNRRLLAVRRLTAGSSPTGTERRVGVTDRRVAAGQASPVTYVGSPPEYPAVPAYPLDETAIATAFAQVETAVLALKALIP